ncbi:MAG: polyamine aminopropyltransferase [Chlamydiales bacterium]|nr:polyamine aminopropyltransferase [Chlamydiales bacterium]
MKHTLLPFMLLSCTASIATELYHEQLHSNWGQYFTIDHLIYKDESGLQDLIIFENNKWGRVLALDGVIQLTTNDEYIYHEMIVHVPLFSHPNPEKVLVIGGGDGGSIREALKHKEVKEVHLIEIDPSVISFSKEYLPSLSNGSFDDPRLKIIICDGADYVAQTKEKYDVIICDTTDEIGPGQVLFTQTFYHSVKQCLTTNGIMVNMDSVPQLNPDYLKKIFNRRSPFFHHVTFYLASIPTYVGGPFAFGFSSDFDYKNNLNLDGLKKRISTFDGKLRYYNPDIHVASFALSTELNNKIFNE